jgi:hypothetical protein
VIEKHIKSNFSLPEPPAYPLLHGPFPYRPQTELINALGKASSTPNHFWHEEFRRAYRKRFSSLQFLFRYSIPDTDGLKFY